MYRAMRRSMLAFIATLFVEAAGAQDIPTGGLLFNQQEDHSLSYFCQQQNDGRLGCDFTHSTVRKKAKPEDLEHRLAAARGDFPLAVEEFQGSKECQTFRVLIDLVEGKSPPEQHFPLRPNGPKDPATFKAGIEKLRARYAERPDELDALKAMDRFCSDRTEENFLNIVTKQFERDVRTCVVSAHTFKQTFTWVSSWGSGKGAWVVDDRPQGPCGVINLSRFEKDDANPQLAFWRYYSRRTVTNPEGEFLPNQTCRTSADQNEYLYDWKNDRDTRMGCEFIEFSSF